MENESKILSRKERERLFKRQEIVTAAREVFAMRGYDAATLDEIAERAEFSKGTLYNYFQNKDELFETVIADVIDEFIEIATDTCTNPDVGLKDSYMAFARRLIQHMFANFGMYGLVMREVHKMEMNTHLATLLPNLILILAEPLERAIGNGDIPSIHPGQTAMVFMTMIFSLFNSTMHVRHGKMFCGQERQLSLTQEEIDEDTENALCIIDRTFFLGIFSKEADHGHAWCFVK
ncbi:MAG: TetR/AcrR family transcriptional regulator [Bacteroidetes bacterium]|nr:TetR/AcrR family transcriptional regulator [Bacteroidota bacterium]